VRISRRFGVTAKKNESEIKWLTKIVKKERNNKIQKKNAGTGWPKKNKKLSYRRGTARCVVSVEILPIATQQCRNHLYDKS